MTHRTMSERSTSELRPAPSFVIETVTQLLSGCCYLHSTLCYPVYGMVHIKDPLLVIEKISPWQRVSSFAIQIVFYRMPDGIKS